MSEPVDSDRVYWAETDPEQAEDSKPPYDTVRVQGHIEGRFLFNTALSKHLLPFMLLPPPVVVLPIITTSNGDLEVKTADQLKADGYREVGKWMAKAERIWTEKRERKASKETAYEWLDYQGKLTSQSLASRHVVLYNAAGTNLSAVHIDRSSLPLPFVVEHKLYWTACGSADEANYLTAVLNAKAVNEAIKPFQSRGLMGERDIEKKVLEVPIPAFDSGIESHRELAALGARAQGEADHFVAATELPSSLAKRRALVRTALSKSLTEIDEIVGRLLAPEHERPAATVAVEGSTARVVRRVHPKPQDRYKSCVPLLTLKAAAGAFGEDQPVEFEDWVEIKTSHPLRKGMFAAQVVGHSMEPLIPDGAYCLFRSPVLGTRQDRIVLVQHHDIHDPDTGGTYTVKRYRSEKTRDDDGTWRHTRIILEPENPAFEAIVLRDTEEGSVRVIAEFLEAL